MRLAPCTALEDEPLGLTVQLNCAGSLAHASLGALHVYTGLLYIPVVVVESLR